MTALAAATLAWGLAGPHMLPAHLHHDTVAPVAAAVRVAAVTSVAAVAPVARALAVDWRTRLPPAPRFDDDDTVESATTPDGRFAVHFTRRGRHAVPAEDANRDGVPDFVAEIAATLSEALGVYTTRLGLRAPLGDVDAPASLQPPVDVFLVDHAGRGDGSYVREACRPEAKSKCQGLMLIDNDFLGYGYASRRSAVRTVASHELFHAVQAAYAADESVVLSEGVATWATETFDETLDDFERAITGYLTAPDQPLGIAPVGPVPAFAYGSALFFRFLSERFDERVVRELYEAMETPRATPAPPDAPAWIAALDGVLTARGTSFAAAFSDFAVWNALAGGPTPQGLGYRNSARYRRVAAETRALPANDTLRVFPSAARYQAITPGTRTRLAARAVGAGPLDVIIIAPAAQGPPVVTRGVGSAAVNVDPAAGTVVVGVSNGAVAGGSARPVLCIGDEAEVAACAAMAPAGMPSDGGAASADDGGGGCSFGGGGHTPGKLAWLVAAFLLASTRPTARRRRRAENGCF